MMTEFSWLLADIGGTNARFALCRPGHDALEHTINLSTADYTSLSSAIRHYMDQIQLSLPPCICVAMAGPVDSGIARLTNSFWEVSNTSLKKEFGFNRSILVNDFTALAHALPRFAESYCSLIGNHPYQQVSEPPRLGVVGPGTGLGAAALIGSTPVISEAGHVGFAPENEIQMQILQQLHHRFDRVSDERLVSGQGIENIYWALGQSSNATQIQDLSAAQIFERCKSGTDEVATRTVEEFFRILGQVAGNFALSVGAYDGIFIAGGIIRRHRTLLATSPFRSGFENKGRHRDIMTKIPTLLIEHPEPGLFGALSTAHSATRVGPPGGQF